MCESKIATRAEIRRLGRGELHRRMSELLGNEHHIEVEFLRHLEAFEDNREWEAFGLTSLWDYCTIKLGLREGAAYRRIQCMRVMRRFPMVEPMLRDGRLCMSTVNLLAEKLTARNAAGLFRAAAGKSTAFVRDEIVAKLNAAIIPQEVIRELGKKLAPISAAAADARRDEVEAAGGTVEAASAGVAPETERAVQERLAAMTTVLVADGGENKVRGVSATQFQVNVTVSREWMEVFRALEARLHVKGIPAVTLYCMEQMQARLAKKDGVAARSPLEEPAADKEKKTYRMSAPGSARIPREMEREVRARDGNRCQWVKPDRTKCLSAEDPQIDHKLAKALGGRTEPPNLQVLCKPHNQQKAREDFGADFIARKIEERRSAQASDRARTDEDDPLPMAEVTAGEHPSQGPPA